MKKDLERLSKYDLIIDSEDKGFKKPEGKFSARERLSMLFDKSGYKELFRFIRPYGKENTFKDGIVCASGFVNGKPVLAYATEFEVFGGSVGKLQAQQIVELYRLAKQSGIPLVAVIESGGARITDAMEIMEGYAGVMMESVICSGVIPQITCVMGHCIGAAAFVATLNDFIIMEGNSTLSVAGSSVNKAATGEDVTDEQLGGVEIHNRFSGAIHFTEKGEKEALEKVRELLQFLPSNNCEPPPAVECHDPENREEPSAESILPDDDVTPFDMKKLIHLFTDNYEFFEIQAGFAPNLITGFARFGGYTVGIAANQSLYLAGAFDCNSFRKMARFVNFLSTYNFPMVTFVDVPGAIPTLDENKNGILIHGSQLLQALGHLKNLKISIVVRRCFGGAYCMMNPKISGGDVILAYPSAMIGVMSDKATSSVFRKDVAMSAKIDALHAKGERLDDPFIAASLGYIDDVIYPSKTRQEIIRAIKMFGNKRFLDVPPKWLNNPPF